MHIRYVAYTYYYSCSYDIKIIQQRKSKYIVCREFIVE